MHNIKVTVYDSCKEQNPPYNLSEYLAWVQAKMGSIPIEFRKSAFIDVQPYESHGCPGYDIEIAYFRPETAEEVRARELSEARFAESRQARERAELARLKAKYEEGAE